MSCLPCARRIMAGKPPVPCEHCAIEAANTPRHRALRAVRSIASEWERIVPPKIIIKTTGYSGNVRAANCLSAEEKLERKRVHGKRTRERKLRWSRQRYS